MSKNIDQVFIANPITTNASTDLMYFGQSPYGVGNDAAMTYANFSAQFGAPYTASALTKTDDTNVTLTLGGTPSTALLHATSLTLGWAGQLSVARGGTGDSSFTAYSLLCGGTTSTGPLQNVSGVGTSGQVLTSNGAGSLPTWQTAGGGGVTGTQIQNQAFSYAFDSGATNAYAITLSPAVTSYVDGQFFSFTANNRNTGASTLNVNGLGAVAIVLEGDIALVGSEILLNNSYQVMYNATLGKFILMNPSGTVLQNQTNVYAVDTGAANAYVVNYNPTLRYLQDGQFIAFKASNANTGASTINPDGLGATSIVDNTNSALASGAILANGTYLLQYNGSFSAFVLINSSASGGGGGGVTAAQIQQQAFTYGVDSGFSSTNYVVNVSPAPSSYTDGMYIVFNSLNNTPNNPATTININGLGAAPIYDLNGNALVGGEIQIAINYILIYSINYAGFILINSSNPVGPWKFGSAFGNTSGAGGGGLASGVFSLAWGQSASARNSSSIALGNNSISNNAGSVVISAGGTNSDSGSQELVLDAGNAIRLYGASVHCNSQFSIDTAGKGLTVKSGSNCKIGTAVLSGGTVTVSNTSVTSNSLILLTPQVAGGTLGSLSIGTVTAGTSFVINSSNALDTSTVGYLIVEQG